MFLRIKEAYDIIYQEPKNMSSIVVKIGGSVSTNKSDSKKPEVLVDQVRACLDNIDFKNLKVLVFGVGSFGHAKAMDIGLGEEPSDVEYSKLDKFLVKLDEYYKHVMEIVHLYGDNFVHVPLSTVDDFETLERPEEGVPVLFGSIVDHDGQAVIVSGDAIVAKLAKKSDIIFYTDVYGVMRKDGEVVSEFHMDDIDDLINEISNDLPTDATGGMKGKLEKLKKFGFKNKVEFRNIHQS